MLWDNKNTKELLDLGDRKLAILEFTDEQSVLDFYGEVCPHCKQITHVKIPSRALRKFYLRQFAEKTGESLRPKSRAVWFWARCELCNGVVDLMRR